MSVLALDTETTTWSKGAPYDPRNALICYSYATGTNCGAKLFATSKDYLDELLLASSVVVGFNIKFDLHWLKKYGISFTGKRIWDVQIAEFILSCQTNRFPSLNDTCLKYGIPTKEDVVKTEYWDKGINTDAIPWPILESYAAHDADITLQCYYKQLELMTPQQVKLCKLQCEDMQILQEMEANGLPFNEELCQVRAVELDDKISTLKRELTGIYPNIPINFGSNDHLSAFLYGGIVREDAKEHIGFFKTGVKVGQPKFKNIEIEHILPRLYTPIKGSEMAKEGNFATDEGTLRKLRGKKGVIEKILELSKMEKLNGTYYRGLTKLRQEQGWSEGVLHGQFNQTTAISGRLSSSKPNLQNFATELQDIFTSRYND